MSNETRVFFSQAMFSSNLAESDQPVIHLRGIQTEILETLIDYAYTSEIRLENHVLRHVDF